LEKIKRRLIYSIYLLGFLVSPIFFNCKDRIPGKTIPIISCDSAGLYDCEHFIANINIERLKKTLQLATWRSDPLLGKGFLTLRICDSIEVRLNYNGGFISVKGIPGYFEVDTTSRAIYNSFFDGLMSNFIFPARRLHRGCGDTTSSARYLFSPQYVKQARRWRIAAA
jgi:hypothetical protein